MKTIEPITVTLELARDLKEAGYGWESIYFWYEVSIPGPRDLPDSDYHKWAVLKEEEEPPFRFVQQKFAAPTADEILALLPTHLVVPGTGKMGGKGNKFHPVMTKWKDKGGELYLMRYRRTGAPKNLAGSDVSGRTLVEAAAKLWLFMKKNNLLPPTV